MPFKGATSSEEKRICAYIDVLGTKSINQSNDIVQKKAFNFLLHEFANRNVPHGPNLENLGGMALVSSPSPEISSFSDHIVMSFPLHTMQIPIRVGLRDSYHHITPSEFMNALLSQIISLVWLGLESGVLFRGAITIGNLYHQGNIVHGVALDQAVFLEKETSMPRIEIHHDVLNMQSDGQPLLHPDIKEYCVQQDAEKYFVNTLSFHVGVWRDCFVRKNQERYSNQDIKHEVQKICISIEEKITQLSHHDDALEKWNWFNNQLQQALKSEPWLNVLRG